MSNIYLLFIYYKLYFNIFIIIQFTALVYVLGTLAAIQNKNKVLIVSFQ